MFIQIAIRNCQPRTTTRGCSRTCVPWQLIRLWNSSSGIPKAWRRELHSSKCGCGRGAYIRWAGKWNWYPTKEKSMRERRVWGNEGWKKYVRERRGSEKEGCQKKLAYVMPSINNNTFYFVRWVITTGRADCSVVLCYYSDYFAVRWDYPQFICGRLVRARMIDSCYIKFGSQGVT